MDYYLWARVIAARTWRGVQTADRDDLLQVGAIALWLNRRIDGAMWDHWRWWTGWGHERQTQTPRLRRARRKCPKTYGRAKGRGAHWTDVSMPDDTPMLMRDLQECIAKTVAHHDDRIIAMAVDHYARGSSLKEVGEDHGISESRVCQLLMPVRDLCRYARERYFDG